MARSLIAIVTAAAMLWHTVIGCCAHHSHGLLNSCDRGHRMASAAYDAEAEAGHGCGGHRRAAAEPCRAHSHRTTGTPERQSVDGEFPTHVPAGLPGGCPEGKCVFAAPDHTGPTMTDLLAGAGPCLAWAELATGNGDSSAGVTRHDAAPPPLGGLRAHLILGVLTL